MNNEKLNELLNSVATGRVSPDKAAKSLAHLPVEDIEYAHIDHHRSLRKGFPEVIFGEGKTAQQIVGILTRMADQENVVLVTRIDMDKAQTVQDSIPEAQYDVEARMIVLEKEKFPVKGRGTVLVISAGTSDIPVAKEAAVTAQAMGNRVETIFDVGVAGIHRLLMHRELLEKATVIVVVAGMEGALPSVVAGLVKSPVIAVPTSIGYGASLGGLAALFGMLNSCSSNVAVVNIDNGFGAGYMAAAINRE
ncbi:MAG: nickel pincer cofactor biosynthesis protein LarB [Deltaproteobacteria bacterium]|nr:nickel pincer cofactor biosynthesis protein LarB [Deltaproteobacteria bacterium]